MKNQIKSVVLLIALVLVSSQGCPTLAQFMGGITYQIKNIYSGPVTMNYRFPNFSKTLDLNQYITNSNGQLKPATSNGKFLSSCSMNGIDKNSFILSATCSVPTYPYKNTLTIDTFTGIQSYKIAFPKYSTCKWLSFLDCVLTLEGSLMYPTGKLLLNCPNPNSLNTRIAYSVDLDQYIGVGSLSNGTDNIMTVKQNGNFSDYCSFCMVENFILRCQCKGMWSSKWSSVNLLTGIKIHNILGYQ